MRHDHGGWTNPNGHLEDLGQGPERLQDAMASWRVSGDMENWTPDAMRIWTPS